MTLTQAVEFAVDKLRKGEQVSWFQLSKATGVHKDRIRSKARRIAVRVAKPATVNMESNFTDQSGEVEIKSKRIVTLDDLLTHCNVDLSLWRVERHVINKWEVGAKDEKGNIIVEPLFQVKAWLVKDDKVVHTENAINYLLERVPPKAYVAPSKSHTGSSLLEISIPDLHVGKLALSPSGDRTYDTRTAVLRFKDSVEKLLQNAVRSGVQIGRIVLPVGNDFLHVDNGKHTTTAGTPQDVDGLWHEAYVAGEEALTWAIERCYELASVEVIIVKGNHDHEAMFSMGRVLNAYFRNYPTITFDISNASRKYRQHGNSMLMWTHGNDEKMGDLPLIMAAEQPTMWASTVYREVHLGHLHKKSADEFTGVRVKILPSLAEPDAWHSKKGYVNNIKSAEAYIWDAVAGNTHNFCINFNHES